MPRLLETIHISKGKVLHLNYHQDRLNRSRHTLGFFTPLQLELTPPDEGEFRCRVVYEKEIESIKYIPYQRKEVHRLKLVHSSISYDLKYEDRSALNALMHTDSDDVIIIKDNLVTDTTIANLCFFDGKEWLTPKTPLLYGTTRQRLLDEKRIKPADIHCKDIMNYEKIALMNAMTDFYIIENAIIL